MSLAEERFEELLQTGHCGVPDQLPAKSSSTNAAAPAAAASSSDTLKTLIVAKKAAATGREPFTEQELNTSVAALQDLLRDVDDAASTDIDWAGYRALLVDFAHLTHKDWGKTESAAEVLANLLGGPSSAAFRTIFSRVLRDGHWNTAQATSADRPESSKPWVVLVTGVNGIRKTSSVYQPWFQEALGLALDGQYDGPTEHLPCGDNAFFRQLDYMVATVANNEFRKLYEVEDDVGLYATLKDAIFARYRTLGELVGALLVKEARKQRMNVLVETSGRDIAMFHYIDHFFPAAEYNKLVVHFTINDISFAERSVDSRMKGEMKAGTAALRSSLTAHGARAAQTINANAGGPYGSAQLKGVQAASDKVWQSILTATEGEAGAGWYKAPLAVEAREPGEWVVRVANGAGGSATAGDGWEIAPRAAAAKRQKLSE